MAIYTLPEDFFLLDEEGGSQYAANRGREVVSRHHLQVNSGQALDAWIKHTWLRDTETVSPGEGRGYLNHVRLLSEYGMEEVILSVGLPSENDADGAVPSIMYKITKPGPLPITDHLGFVRFVPNTHKETEVVWTIKLTPSGNSTFEEIAAIVQPMVDGALTKLAETVAAGGKL